MPNASVLDYYIRRHNKEVSHVPRKSYSIAISNPFRWAAML